MSRLFFEVEGDERCPHEFGGPSDVLVYFLSLAFSTRYGAQHDLSQLALLLRGEYQIDLGPITTFADREVEVEADRRELERVWQDAGPLAGSLRAVSEALAGGDERIEALTKDTPGLRARLDDLLRMAAWAAERGRRVRLTFEL